MNPSDEESSVVPSFVRQNTVAYEEKLESCLEGDPSIPGTVDTVITTTTAGGESRAELFTSTKVYHSKMSVSQTTVIGRKVTTTTDIIPGSSSIMDADELDESTTSRRLEISHSSGNKLTSIISKFEFLSSHSQPTAALRSRTPSGDTTGSSKSFATSSRLESPEHAFEQTVLTPQLVKVSAFETRSFKSAYSSPSSLLSSSRSSQTQLTRSTDSDLNKRSLSPLSLGVTCPTESSSSASSVPNQEFDTSKPVYGNTVLKKIDKSLLVKEIPIINSPDSVEWYSEYKSKFGKNLEVGSTKTGKLRADSFDSHIADVKGKP